MTPAPSLNIPPSSVTVRVSAIDTTARVVGMLTSLIFDAEIPGYERFTVGAWCFLIEHPSGRKLIYDLGARKDWKNSAPAAGAAQMIEHGMVQDFTIEKNVSEILSEGGLRLEDVEAIVWSHYHIDHTGDPSTFPTSTKLIVGPGTQEHYFPGYPADPNSHILESDYAGREIVELDFSKSDSRVGRFAAIDYFGDGSFYLLDSPGHTAGHISALARTHASPNDGFVHMCGDSAHHAAEIRPTKHLPLPDSIATSPIPNLMAGACPGHLFAPILRNGDKTEHILEAKRIPGVELKHSMVFDEPAQKDTVRKVEESDANDSVFTILAHDWSLKDVIAEYPQTLNEWKEAGWRTSTRWSFLSDFEKAVQPPIVNAEVD